MQSVNNQFLEFSDQVVKRYTKTRLLPITGYRLNPRNAVNPNERIDFILATPEDNVEYFEYTPEQTTMAKQIKFTYDLEVLELYSEVEVRAFERMNRQLIENGLLVEYSEDSPAINKSNTLTDAELRAIAKIKSVNAFKVRLQEITSVFTLQTLGELLETIDTATVAQVRAVKERIDELKRN